MNDLPDIYTDELAPWQLWYIKHAFCGGKLRLIVGRKGPYYICTCEDEARDEN